MKQDPAQDVLRRVFAVITRAAGRDPAFAREIIDALQMESRDVAPAVHKPDQPARFDASSLHAIIVLRTHGEDALRGKLEQLKKSDDLRSIARSSGLVLSGRASSARASRNELIDGIVSAAKHYAAQRDAAAS